MPIEYVTDPRTGRIVAKGSLGFGQAVVPEAPPRPRQPAKPRPSKPKQPGIFGFGANGFSLDKLGNDLRYELNQLRSDPVRSVQRAVATRPEAQIALGGATALSNAARAVIEYKQKASGRPKADYTTSPVGRAVDAYEDTVFRALNQTPPSQMTGQEKAIRDMRGSVTLAVATSLGGGALLNAARGVRFIGPAAQALSNITNPGNATTAIGAVGRVAADAVVGELASTPLDDNTGGSAAGLVDMVLGTKLDPVKPGMDRPEAAAAAFGPNALAGFALAGPLVGLGRWAGHARARSAQRAAQPVQQARAELEAAGLTQTEPESGVSAFTPEATQGAAPTLSEVNAALEVKYGIRPAEPAKAPDPAAAPIQPMEPGGAVTAGKLPTADPAVDPWNVDYDPALPEADVALTLVKNASDNELLDALRGDGALLDQLDQTMANRLPVEPDPALSTELTAAPTDNLAPPITPFADQWKRLAQKDPNALLAVLHPDVNPGLAERAQAMFGRGWEDLTPQDAVDTLQAAAADGMTVMPNRLLPGQQIMRTSDIKPGPKLERAPGSTLKDASQWDNELEGVVDVWKDPASGNYFAVNGRSRLDLAKRTGVNSLVVREVQADSLEQARQLSLQDENAVLTPDAAEPQAAPDGSAIDQPQQLAEVLPEDRPALELAAIQRAIQNGEVRPPETPIPDMPADSGVNLLKVQRDLAENTITDDVVRALDDELALREQFKQIDQVVAQETEKAARDAVGYDLLTFEEKKQAGMLDGIQEPAPLLRPGTELHHGTQEQFRKEILRTGFRASKSEKAGTVLGDGVHFAQNERYARAYGRWIVSGRLPDEARILDLISQNKSVADLANEVGVSGDVDVSLGYARLTYPQQEQIRQWATSNGYDGIRFRSYDTPDLPQAEIVVYNIGLANKIAGAAPPSAFSFPADLAKSAPRYGMAKVEFASDLDRAAYMLRDSSKKSKGEDRLIKALEEAGYSIPAIRMHGEKVKQALKDAVTEQTGSAAAPQSAMALRVPEQKIDAGELDSPAGWDSIDNSPFNPDPQESLRRQEELRQIIREVAGDEVTMRFQDHYETVIKSPEWGGDGKATTTRGGFYRLLQDLIQVNGVMHDTLGHTGLAPSRVETAYHESFHRLQYIALSPEEASILNGNWARIKVGIGSGHLLVKKPIAYSESQAVAFQRYAAAKRAGADPVAAMLGSYRPDTNAAQKALGFVVSAFDRILDVAEKLYNGLTKGTFDSTRAIFERARRGDLAQADNWEGPGGMTNPGSGMDMMDRPASEYGWRRSSAFKESLRGGGAGDLASPGPSPGQLFDDLNSVLGDPDPRTGMVRGLSKSAVKQALNGDASRALSEGMQLAEIRLSDLNARIEAVKQRAAQEGC
jgi:hypothetical protein